MAIINSTFFMMTFNTEEKVMRMYFIAVVAALASLAAPHVSAGPLAYIANCSPDLSIIDTANQSVVTTAYDPGPGCVYGVAANETGSRIYFGNRRGGVTVLDTQTQTFSKVTVPNFLCSVGLAINRAGTRGYLTDSCPGSMAVLDLTTTPISVITTLTNFGGGGLYGVVVSPDDGLIYVASYGGAAIAVVDASTYAVQLVPTPGRNPYSIAVSPSGSTVYISHEGAITGMTAVTRLETLGTLPPIFGPAIPTGLGRGGIAVHPSGGKVYVVNGDSSTVSVIDTSTNAVTTVPSGIVPVGVSVNPSGSLVYVPNYVSNSVSVFDADLNLVTTIDVGVGSVSIGNFIPQGRVPANPVAKITDLLASIAAANLADTRLRNSLTAPLNASLNWLNGNDPRKVQYACSNLAKFIAVVRQNILFGKLPAALGNPWVEQGNSILVMLGCPTR